jgi:hypothetical protein
MNIKANIASKYIPAYEKNKKYFQLLVEYLIATYDSLTEEYGVDKAKMLISTISSRAGIQVANILRTELALGETYESAVLSWKIGCRLLGLKIHTTADQNGVLFYHDYDPLWLRFKEKSLDLCTHLCLPLVSAVAREICPGTSSHYERAPTLQSTCIKLLKFNYLK